MRQVVRWSNGSLTVRSGLVEDEIAAQIIERVVRTARVDEQAGFWMQFGRLCAQTEASEGIDWHPETVRGMNEIGVRHAYECFLKLPRPIWEKWIEALDVVEEVRDITLGPAPLPENADPKA